MKAINIQWDVDDVDELVKEIVPAPDSVIRPCG